VERARSYRSTDKHEKPMIKNIVFDLGNVLLSFRPEEFLDNNGYDENTKRIIINEIFKSSEWLMLDKGDITTTEAIESISAKSSLKTEEIASVFNLRTKIIFPLALNTILLPALRKQGFKLYYLSNFPDDIFDEVNKKYDFFRNFDGGIISGRVHVSKPDKKIFSIFLEKYSLSADETLFIDDSELNIKAAESIGMTGLHIHLPEDLWPELRKIPGISFPG
jgi:epoxide hydrolase-like predicted phosphatase